MNTLENPRDLVDTRIQLHWAAQILSSAADASLEKANDDSHSNLGWNATTQQLEGRTGAALNVVDFYLLYDGNSFDLHQKSLADGMKWLGDKLGQTLAPREYEMPEHEVSAGAKFQPKEGELRSLGDWFTFGQSALAGQGELRVWPHHFDLGFFKPDVADGKSLGGGFSPGDDHYPLPYIYINPYGMDRPQELPQLEFGFWAESWFGAVITADQFHGPNGRTTASQFTEEAVSICTELLTDR